MTDEQLLSECREEANRLKLVDRATQREIIAIHRAIAADEKVPRSDREHARQRADALERFLGLAKRKRKQPPP